MKVKFVKFDVFSAPKELWNAFFRHIDRIDLEIDPDESLLPRQNRKADILSFSSNPDFRSYRFLMFPEDDSGNAIGFGRVFVETPHSPSYQTNKHEGMLDLSISKEYRRKGLGVLFLRHIIDEVRPKESAVTEFVVPVLTGPGISFMKKLGATVSLERSENRLYLKDVDWDMVGSWVREGEAKNPGTVVKMVRTIPEEDLLEYSEVFTETENQQPLGDTDIRLAYTPGQIRYEEETNRKLGVECTTMYSKESDGKISGLTAISYRRVSGYKIQQTMTGVRDRYRGRGLGKMLKAKMLMNIRKEYTSVKYIDTGNADSNAAMMAINKRLGFKRHLPVILYKLLLR